MPMEQKRKNVAKRLSAKFNKLWVGAEVMLFVLVGATVDIRYAAVSYTHLDVYKRQVRMYFRNFTNRCRRCGRATTER